MLMMTFVDPSGSRLDVEAWEGWSVLDVAQHHGINLEGTCEGCMACSTCHVIIDEIWFGKLEKASEEEDDMLDLAFDVRPTSRLGCQIILVPRLDGLVVSLPTQHFNLIDS